MEKQESYTTSRNVFIAVIAVEAMILIVPWLVFGLTLEALQTTTRFSGRFSLVLFSMILGLVVLH